MDAFTPLAYFNPTVLSHYIVFEDYTDGAEPDERWCAARCLLSCGTPGTVQCDYYIYNQANKECLMGNLVDQATPAPTLKEFLNTPNSLPLASVNYVSNRISEIADRLSDYGDACPTKGIAITPDFADLEFPTEADCVVNVFNNLGGEVTLTLAEDWALVSRMRI